LQQQLVQYEQSLLSSLLKCAGSELQNLVIKQAIPVQNHNLLSPIKVSHLQHDTTNTSSSSSSSSSSSISGACRHSAWTAFLLHHRLDQCSHINAPSTHTSHQTVMNEFSSLSPSPLSLPSLLPTSTASLAHTAKLDNFSNNYGYGNGVAGLKQNDDQLSSSFSFSHSFAAGSAPNRSSSRSDSDGTRTKSRVHDTHKNVTLQSSRHAADKDSDVKPHFSSSASSSTWSTTMTTSKALSSQSLLSPSIPCSSSLAGTAVDPHAPSNPLHRHVALLAFSASSNLLNSDGDAADLVPYLLNSKWQAEAEVDAEVEVEAEADDKIEEHDADEDDNVVVDDDDDDEVGSYNVQDANFQDDKRKVNRINRTHNVRADKIRSGFYSLSSFTKQLQLSRKKALMQAALMYDKDEVNRILKQNRESTSATVDVDWHSYNFWVSRMAEIVSSPDMHHYFSIRL
jgi:hypothetical protein